MIWLLADFMRGRGLCLLAAAFLLAGCGAAAQGGAATAAEASGTTYYVATDGSDSHAGAQTKPWRTIQHAADVLQPGDTALVRAGTYAEEVELVHSGAPGQPITFAAYPGETVLLDGGGTLYSAFQTVDRTPDPHVSDIVITGFTIRNYRGFGIVAWSVNNRLTLLDLVIENSGDAGIRLSNSDGSRIERVALRHNQGGFDCTPILPGLASDPGCTHLYLADVQAIDNGTQGDTGTDAFAVERGAHILVERCLASGGVGDGFDFKSDHTTLRRVEAHDTRNNIKLWGVDSTLVNALAYDAYADANLVLTAGGSYTITNVTIANMRDTAYLVVAGDTSDSGPTPVRISNSIFYNDNPKNEGTLLLFGPDVTQAEVTHNLFYNPYRTDDVICAEFAPYNGDCFSATDINQGVWTQPQNRYADPAFVNPSAKNFRLQVNSPAVDKGSAGLGPPDDLAGNLRDAQPDLGAYEQGAQGTMSLFLPLLQRK